MAANPKFNDWLANRSGIPAHDAKALAARHSRDGMELLLALAAILILRSFFLRGPAPAMRNLKPLVIVLGSVFLFGVAAPRLGIVPATLLLILISSSADREFRWKEAVVSSLILAAFTVGVFIYGLGLQLPIWPPFLVPR